MIVEGIVQNAAEPDDDALDAYRSKSNRDYDVAEFGALTRLGPRTIIAWRAAGWAGQDSFRETGKWTFG